MITLNPKNKLFRWGPIDGLPIYAYYWHRGFIDFTGDFPPGWATFISYFEDEKIWAICEYAELYDKGEAIFKKYVLNDRQFKKNYMRWNLMIEDFIGFRDSISSRLKTAEKPALIKSVKEWNLLFGNGFWNIGSLPETANWGGEQILERELRKKLKNDADFHFAMERLSSPEDFSFYQIEELDLLKIKNINNKKQRDEKIIAHQQKYFWMLNNYHTTKVLPVSYFKKILNSISDKEAKDKIKEINRLKAEAIKHKREVLKKFKLPYRLLKISQRLAFCVWWQDLRKSYIFQANHIIDILLKGVSKKFKADFNDLHYYSVNELENFLLNDKKISAKEIKDRKKGFFVLLNSKKTKEFHISGKLAREAVLPFISDKIDRSVKQFSGIVVNRGFATGKVKILTSTKDLWKMKKGDILVASMTAPDYIVALKKAAAVVTDEGGMTCHAAIVSRELKIPGIVGTGVATKLLKDGDLVEVDANKGVVKILKN